jgi:hypothetical protein
LALPTWTFYTRGFQVSQPFPDFFIREVFLTLRILHSLTR